MKVSFREIYIICAGDDGCMKVAIFFMIKSFVTYKENVLLNQRICLCKVFIFYNVYTENKKKWQNELPIDRKVVSPI